MKLIFVLSFILITSLTYGQTNEKYSDYIDTTQTQLTVDKSDSSTSLFANMQSNHTFYGYAKPDTNSKRLILFSIFTSEVENDKDSCLYGAHYSDTSLGKKHLKYIKNFKDFGEFQFLDNTTIIDTIFFRKENFKFDE